MKLFRLYQKLPSSWRRIIEKVPVDVFGRQYSRSLDRAFLSGPPYRPSHRSIIIDITEACDLGCIDCSRSCGTDQAPSQDCMELDQIERFIEESRSQGRKWEVILIEGGEPTVHPRFLEIVSSLAEYIGKETPRTVLQVNTNGYSDRSRELAGRLPSSVLVHSSNKQGRSQKDHILFNLAPQDLSSTAGFDFSQGCYLPAFYGMGLNRYGYYPHPNCGAVDRVFGLDIGRKSLPVLDDPLEDLFPRLCRYCGVFLYLNRLAASTDPLREISGDKYRNPLSLAGIKSESWERAYRSFRLAKPVLSVY